MLKLIDQYTSSYGKDWTIEDALVSLQDYFNRYSDQKHLDGLHARFRKISSDLGSEIPRTEATAIKELHLAEHRKVLDFDFNQFYEARHSIREFSTEPVDASLIKECVGLAMRAPSVCNRQPWRVYCVTDKEKIHDLIEIQGGGRGFSKEVDKLLVTSVDLAEFYANGERNECYVEGGIILQSLLLCLHGKGLGACPLNWCVSRKIDRMARQKLPIQSRHTIVAFIAVGNLKDKTKYARSGRRPVEDILTFV
jgi:nitroreductase